MSTRNFSSKVADILFYLAFLSFLGLGLIDGNALASKLLIVSFDGFRWDYLGRTKTPWFDFIKKNGVTARYGIRNAFVTKTLPNHFTLVTGLWEESHGIVGNEMWDDRLNETFEAWNDTEEAQSRWFDVGAEPVWVTNQLQSKGGLTGCMMWVGCQAPIQGVLPTHHVPYNSKISNESRIDAVVEWLAGAHNRPVNLGLLYFEQPDAYGHQFGPDSPQVNQMIEGLDSVVGYLIEQLRLKDLLKSMNIIITSDHGFAATPEHLVVNLDDYIDPRSYRAVQLSPVTSILPNEGMAEIIYQNLSKGAMENGNFQVYMKDDVPKEFHYSHHWRIQPIIVVAHENYSIIHNHSVVAPRRGDHGYNNSLPDMHPFFLAMGPDFRKGASVDTFQSVDVYPLMCHLLGLKPAPNNGSLDVVRQLLVDRKQASTILTFGTCFRWDYVNGRMDIPNFERIKTDGVVARRGMKSAYITETLPNHFTLVTGLWVESHGITGDEMWDPELKEAYPSDGRSESEDQDPNWWDTGAEPIWVTNQLQKKNGRSGCMMWVGCEAPIMGMTPTRHQAFDAAMDFRTRVDIIIKWFLDKYPINLGLLYFEKLDEIGRKYGPDSKEVGSMIKTVDEHIGYLLEKLEEYDLLESTNVIITSDHGFAATSKYLLVNLDDAVRPDSYRIFTSSSVAGILPNEGLEDTIYSNLSLAANKNKTFSVYRKSEFIPDEYHYKNHRRILPILVQANENYTIVKNHSMDTWREGSYGYNNSLRNMFTLFMAVGPGFRKGAEVETLDNVDVYSLMCHLLGLKPAANNGSLDVIRVLLEDNEKTTMVTFGTYFFVLFVIATVGGIFVVAACRQHRYLKRQRGKIRSMDGPVTYSVPSNSSGKVPLLSETDEDETFQ